MRSSTTRAALGQAPLGLERAAAAGADLAQLLVQARALALEVRGAGARSVASRRARASTARRPCSAEARRGARPARRGRVAQSTRHGRLGGMGRRRAAHRGHVVEQRAVGVVADRGDHRHAEQRHGAAEGLIAEAQQVGQRAAAAGHDHHLDLRRPPRDRQRAHDRRRRVAVLHRREAPHQASRPAAPRERREHVVARLAALAGDRRRSCAAAPAGQALLALEQALGVELLAQPLDAGQQVASPASRSSSTAKEKPGEEVALPG